MERHLQELRPDHPTQAGLRDGSSCSISIITDEEELTEAQVLAQDHLQWKQLFRVGFSTPTGLVMNLSSKTCELWQSNVKSES